MHIRDEELIAYLLGDADKSSRERIEVQLLASNQLRDRLRQLRIMLGHLDSHRAAYEVPADLLRRTLEFVQVNSSDERTDANTPRSAGKVSLRPAHLSPPAAVQRGVWDSVGMSLSIALLCCLLLPTILRARFESRRIQCMENLKYLGAGLIELAGLSTDQRFPAVAEIGPESFAGVFAVRLNDAGMLESTSRLICVSQPRSLNNGSHDLIRLPSLAQFALLNRSEVSFFRRIAGGDYAYNLGVVEAGRVMAPRLEGRSNFAILADAPVMQPQSEFFIAHSGQGLNILFEDGHVEFIAVDGWNQPTLDHPFRNRRGAHDVGLDVDDASLAPSYFAPPRAVPQISSILGR